MKHTEQSKRTILFQAIFLLFFSAAFMFLFYISRWYPGRSSNVFLALGFGLAVSVPFFLNSILIKRLVKKGKPLYTKNGFKLILHFLSIYLCVLLFSALTNTLVIEWQQFVIIFLVLALIGLLPSLFFYYFGKYQRYKSFFQDSKKENKKLNEQLELLRSSVAAQTVLIPLRNGSYSLNLNDFYYAESDKNYLIITFISLEKVQIRTTIKRFLDACQNEPNIRQIHRAYVINVNHFNRFQAGFAFLDAQNIKLPISKSFNHQFLAELEK